MTRLKNSAPFNKIKYKFNFVINAFKSAFILLLFTLILFKCDIYADQLDIAPKSSGSSSYLTDGSYSTGNNYHAGDTITIDSDLPISYLYIIWDSPVSEWTLDFNATSMKCGTNGFLHELVKLTSPSASITINIESNSRICGIYAFTEGELPDFVQEWKPPCSEADILAFSTHADDEILFLGGVLATYGGEQGLPVQVCYMTNYWNGLRIREHEKLDGLWESGIRNYPVNGDFDDIYSETLEAAKTTYNYDDVLEYVTGQIRTFKPNVVVTQDLNGEYGHGGHMLLASAVTEAVSNSMDSSFYPEQAATIGTWDVPKTYLHLYSESPIWLDLNTPLDKLGSRTAIETAKDAYLKHVSQQWCWFYVSDTYQYSCAKFGLYRTTVGADTQTGYNPDGSISSSGGNMLENITTKAEAAALKEKEEAERRKNLELQSSKDSAQDTTNNATSDIQSNRNNTNSGTVSLSGRINHLPAFIILAAMILLLILVLALIMVINKKKKR